MPAKTFYRAGGVWREMKSGTAVRSGGAWRTLKNAYRRVGGTWQLVFQAFAVSLGTYGASGYNFGTVSSAGMRFEPNGNVSANGDGSYSDGGDWGIPNTAAVGANYWIRATLSSGDTPAGPALGSWHQLSVNREWTISVVAPAFDPQSKACSLAVAIATDSGGTNIVSTGSVSLSCQADGNV